MTIHELLLEQRGYLGTLAESWLATGATTFSVWCEGKLLLQWPEGAFCAATVRAPIQVGARTVGTLGITGMSGDLTCRRLAAEAKAVGRMLTLESELEEMTFALVETQDKLLALYELSQATRNNFTITDILRRIACETVRLVQAEGAVLLLAPTLVQHPANRFDERVLLDYFRYVQQSGQEQVINDLDVEQTDGIQNLCLLPISIRGNVVAVLGIINREHGFATPDLKLARTIAEQAGIMIENSLLYEENLAQARLQTEIDIARKVQMQMLPRQRPQITGLEVYAESRPARHVGGDFYDFVEVPGRMPIFMLGDVVGKGVSAALIMGMLHAISHSAARFMPKPTPASVLYRTNEDLYDDLTTLEAFATMFVAQYEPVEQLLHYSNAGHAPIIYRANDGCAGLLEADGMPIGVLLECFCENQTVAFGPGALLVAATDGFNEAHNLRGEMFGYERLLELIDLFADQPAQVIAGAMFDAVNDFAAGRGQDDDQTLIIIKGVAI